MRGEDKYIFPAVAGDIGTPPHAWGRSEHTSRNTETLRYTPTCVGKILRKPLF